MFFQKLKLVSIDYNLSNTTAESFKYNFEGGLSIYRSYISPFIRINSHIPVFKIPFLKQRIFTWELIGVCLTGAIIAITFICLHRASFINNEINYKYILLWCLRLVALLTLSNYIFTTLIAEVLIFLYGKSIVGTVIYTQEYHDAGNERKARFKIELPNGTKVLLEDFLPETFNMGESVNLKIHPDNIPYIVFKHGFRIYLKVILFALIYFSLVYECVKGIL